MTSPKKRYLLSFLAASLACALLAASCAGEPAARDAASFALDAAGTRDAAAFPPEPPGRLDRRALARAGWQLGAPYAQPLLPASPELERTTILGEAEATQRQMVHFIEQRNPAPKLNCTVAQIVSYYYAEAGREGIRADIALCQALKETGFFAYGGDVLPEQNNFCGLGATGNHVRGAAFATPELGVRAHIQHLLAYATTRRPQTALVDPRYEHVRINRPDIYGQTAYWTQLNGLWAVPGTYYGQDILNLWRQAIAPDGSADALHYANLAVEREGDARAYLYRGIALAAQGRTAEAIRDDTEALRREPTAEGYYDRALCYAQAGDTAHAIADYASAIREDPKLPQAWYNRALAYMSQGQYKEAIRDFEETLLLIPQMASARSNIGVAHIHLQDYDAAWKDFYEAGQINTENAVVHANQAAIAACVKKKR